MTTKYDIAIIGSGPGGYVAAIRASQLGFKTVVIEKEALGGICLNWGCIPTKALLKAADIYSQIKKADTFGINVPSFSFEMRQIIARSRQVSQQLTNGIKTLMKKNQINVIYGHAKLLSKNRISIANETETSLQEIEASHMIIATGARAKSLPNLPIDHDIIWDYKDAMTCIEMPKSLLVVGSGAIGIEFASFYAEFGCKVTIIDIAKQILVSEDEEIAAFARKSFEKKGIEIITAANIQSYKIENNCAKVLLEIKETDSINDIKIIERTFHRVLSAVGVLPNTDNIGLENTKVTLKPNGYIEIDEFMQTKEDGIYAVGDVTTFPLLAHKASHQGIVCVEKIAKLPNVHGILKENIPGCIYSSPQIASVGLKEKEAILAGHEIRVGKFPFVGNGKAIAMGQSEGLIKLIFENKTGELLGAHLIGSEVTELISALVLAKTAECTEAEIIDTIFPHPTLSEMLHEATLAGQNRAIHI